MTTEDELLRLAADNLGSWERIRVAHYFTFIGSTLAERVALRDDLLDAGVGSEPGEIGSDEEVTGDNNWHIWAFTIARAEREALIGLDRAARDAAERRGARYDGWQVMRDVSKAARREP